MSYFSLLNHGGRDSNSPTAVPSLRRGHSGRRAGGAVSVLPSRHRTQGIRADGGPRGRPDADFSQWRRAERTAERWRQNLYVSDMVVAEKALAEGQVRRAEELLAGHVPLSESHPDLRGFEWFNLWNRCRGDQVAQLPPDNLRVFAVACSPDGRLVATGSSYLEDKDYSGELRLFDRATCRQIATLVPPSADGIRSLAFSADGRLLASGSAGAVVTLWDMENRSPLTSYFSNEAGAVATVMFSRDGALLAAAFPGNFSGKLRFGTSVIVRSGKCSRWIGTRFGLGERGQHGPALASRTVHRLTPPFQALTTTSGKP
jgi:hypothetical protein